jgi:hypothetical protein
MIKNRACLSCGKKIMQKEYEHYGGICENCYNEYGHNCFEEE